MKAYLTRLIGHGTEGNAVQRDCPEEGGRVDHSDDPHSSLGIQAHREQIEHLFREHNESLIRFLAAQLHDWQEAKEVAQEAYVRMLALDNPEAVSYLRTFLFRTAANIAIDRLRQRSGRGRVDTLVFFDAERTSPSPEPTCIATQELELIQRAIDELPPLCREAFILVRFDGLSFDEVAERLGLNARTVFRYVARAIEHCHATLERANSPRDRPSEYGRSSIEDR